MIKPCGSQPNNVFLLLIMSVIHAKCFFISLFCWSILSSCFIKFRVDNADNRCVQLSRCLQCTVNSSISLYKICKSLEEKKRNQQIRHVRMTWGTVYGQIFTKINATKHQQSSCSWLKETAKKGDLISTLRWYHQFIRFELISDGKQLNARENNVFRYKLIHERRMSTVVAICS